MTRFLDWVTSDDPSKIVEPSVAKKAQGYIFKEKPDPRFFNDQFNLIDNNAAKDLSIRLGPKATLIEEFDVNRSYFGAEFGDSPTTPLHLEPKPFAGIHGNLYETHNNSVFSARSFFQAGGVKPAQGKRVRVRCGGSALERRKVLPRRQPTENTGQCEWKRPCPPSRRADSSD